MKSYEEVNKVKIQHEQQLLSTKGVHSVGVGAVTQEDGANSPGILIYVESGKKAELLRSGHISSTLDGVAVNIIEEAPLSLDILYLKKGDASNEDYGRFRPLVGGIQLYLHNANSAWLGTLGTFVKSTDASDSNLYLLSNLHVLSSVGLGVFQPLPGSRNLVGATSLAKEFPDTDAALALLDNPQDIALNTIEGIGQVKEMGNISYDIVGKRVLKRGRTTLLTEGTVESIHTTVTVSGTQKQDCVIVRADSGKLFSSRGDSGSPVVFRDEYKLVGLHFAGNSTLGGISVFCAMENVFRNLNIALPS